MARYWYCAVCGLQGVGQPHAQVVDGDRPGVSEHICRVCKAWVERVHAVEPPPLPPRRAA